MRKRLLLLVGLAALAAVVFSSGLHERLHPEALRSLLTGSGPWGPLLFVALFAGLEAFGVPGILFVVTAVAVWPPWLAFLLNWGGAVGAGCVGFGFARSLGGDWLARRLPASLAGLEARIAQRDLATVILVRLLFFLAPPAHWALGLTRVRFRALLLGSILGLAPGIAALSFGGSALYAWLDDRPAWTWLLVLGVGLLLLGLWSRVSRSGIRLQSAAESAPREGST